MNVSYVEIFVFQGHSSSRNRTYNLTVNSRALYRLSYEGINFYRKQDSNLRSH